ncbi:MAG: IPT/TIG domain-containing protein [Niabella sp.]
MIRYLMRQSSGKDRLTKYRGNDMQIMYPGAVQKAVYFFLLVMATVASTVFVSCSKKVSESASSGYDPSLPITLTSFMPDSGGIRTKFIIKGSNFGSDTSLVKVYFSDSEGLDKKATIVGIDDETIYCLVPKQAGGSSKIKVKIEGDSSVAANTFTYNVAQNVSNIVGVSGTSGSVDGTLSDGRIQRTFGIAAVAEEELISFETLSSMVRYISVADNSITTLQTGFDGTQPAMSKDRTVLYSIGRASPHKIYRYRKANLWQPEILAAQISSSSGLIMAAALDDTEEWIYFRDKNGVFGKVEIANPTNIVILNSSAGTVGSSDYCYLTYSPVDDCFFMTVQSTNGVYKVSKTGVVETYAGFNNLGYSDGTLATATFYNPVGMCVDSEGNIYVADSNSFIIRKINRLSGYVSTIAGIPMTAGGLNGVPLESTFSYPYCISADESDNFYIGESWGCTIRKLAIE